MGTGTLNGQRSATFTHIRPVGRHPLDHGGLRRRHQLHHEHLGTVSQVVNRPAPRPAWRPRSTRRSSASRSRSRRRSPRRARLGHAHRHGHVQGRRRQAGCRADPHGGSGDLVDRRPVGREPLDHRRPTAATPTSTPAPRGTLSQVVNQASTAAAIASTDNPSVFGQSVTFTATVTSATGRGHADRHRAVLSDERQLRGPAPSTAAAWRRSAARPALVGRHPLDHRRSTR